MDALIVVTAGGSGVVVEGLVLDASGTVGGPYFAGDTSSLPGSIVAVPKVRFSNNTVTCGPGFCTFFSGTPGAMVFGNTFMTAGSSTGIHMQGAGPTVLAIPIDGSRVEGNTVVTTAPPCTFFFLGGIRTIGGRRVVIRDNVVRGSWCASISASILTESMITDNRFEGAAGNGIEFGNGRGGVTARIRVQKTLVLHNTASGAGKARPGTLNYSSAGAGSASHFAAERLLVSAGFTAQHIPFKGGAESLTENAEGGEHVLHGIG